MLNYLDTLHKLSRFNTIRVFAMCPVRRLTVTLLVLISMEYGLGKEYKVDI